MGFYWKLKRIYDKYQNPICWLICINLSLVLDSPLILSTIYWYYFRIMSNANALVSIILSVYCIFLEEGMSYSDVWYDSGPGRLACALINGYMLAGINKLYNHI